MADLSVMGFLNEETQQETEYNLKDAQARSDISTINSKIPSNASSNNKLATISDVSAAYKPKGNATLATLPSLTAEHLNWVYNMTEDFVTTSDFAEGAGKSVKAGNEVGIMDVSATSTPSYKYTVLGGFIDTSSLQPKELDTPVEVGGVNRTTVEAALGALANDKEDNIFAASPLVKEYDEIMMQEILRLTQDDTPTDNSNNPVKSSGIKSALDATVDLLKDTTGWLGGNRAKITRTGTTSANGVAYTVNANKSVSANGATTDSSSKLSLNPGDNAKYDFVAGEKIVLCGGVSDKIRLNLFLTSNPNTEVLAGSTPVEWTVPTTGQYTLQAYISPNTTVDNVTLYPMILTPEQYALNPAYRPYHESVELSKYNRSEANILGAKNRWNFPAWKGVATTDATVSWDDDTYTLTLTSTANSGRTNITVPENAQINVIPNERIKFVWDSTGSDDSVMTFDIFEVGETSATIASASVHDNQLVFTVPANCTKITYRVYSNSANKVIKMANCMCLCADDTDLTFKKFTMTNRQLTERFIKVPFTIPSTLSSLTKLADYPTGYNASNSVIVSFSVGGRTGVGQFAGAFERLWVTLANDEIQIFNTEQNNVGINGYVILGKL